jgi:hypothetical protein
MKFPIKIFLQKSVPSFPQYGIFKCHFLNKNKYWTPHQDSKMTSYQNSYFKIHETPIQAMGISVRKCDLH